MRTIVTRLAFAFLFGATTLAHAGRTLVNEADIDATPSEVWRAWTTEEGFTSWAVAKARIDFRVGGEFVTSYIAESTLDDDSTIINRILSFEPERMLSIQNVRAPKAFKNAELFQNTWSVIYLEPLDGGRTRVRAVGMGYGEGPEWDEIYNKFKVGNEHTLKKLQQKFAPSPPDVSVSSTETEVDAHNIVASEADSTTSDPQRVMALLGRLVGGEWIHDGKAPDGSVFLVRNVLERGPDGVSIVSRGWLGDDSGMAPHGSTQIYREPQTGAVRFFSIDEHSSVSQGDIVLAEADTVQWNWNLQGLDGKRAAFRVHMKFADENHYQFALSVKGEEGHWTQMVNADFARVKEAPARFTKLRASP